MSIKLTRLYIITCDGEGCGKKLSSTPLQRNNKEIQMRLDDKDWMVTKYNAKHYCSPCYKKQLVK